MRLTKIQRAVLEKLKRGVIVWWGQPAIIWHDRGYKQQFTWITSHTVRSLKRRGLLVPHAWQLVLLRSEAGEQAMEGKP